MVELLNHNGASANWVMKTPVVGGVFRPCDPKKKGISMAMAKPVPKMGFYIWKTSKNRLIIWFPSVSP